MQNPIKLYYARLANMGDLLNPLIIERCFGCDTVRCSFLDGQMSAIGSGLAMYTLHGTPAMKLRQRINGIVRPHVDVWGTGFINYTDSEGRFFKKDMRFHALRGELTRRNVERMLGRVVDVPTGDAGILASELLDKAEEKRYDIGVIPHICDLSDDDVQQTVSAYDNAVLINVKDDPIEVIRRIAQCRVILSSSLHGLVVADSFNIPNIHALFTDKPLGDGYKFDDYYSAYAVEHIVRDLRVSAPPSCAEIEDSYLITPKMVEEKKRLMRESFPYKKND